MTGAPLPDELSSVVDEGLRVVDERLAGSPDARIYDSLNGVDTDAVGKTIDVTLQGDTAYARGLGLPLVLTGLGLIVGVLAALRVRALVRRRRPENRPPLPG